MRIRKYFSQKLRLIFEGLFMSFNITNDYEQPTD